MMTPIVGLMMTIIGILLNIYGLQKIKEVRALDFFSKSMFLKIFSNILYIIGWVAGIYGVTILYGTFFAIAGIIILIITIVIFWGVHKEIYVERTELMISPIGMFFILSATTFEIEKVIKSMISAFGIGLGFMASSFAIYGCYKLYNRRKGGAILWLMVALYVLMILLVDIIGLIVIFYEVLGLLSPWDILDVYLSSLILPDIIAFYSSYYYDKKIRPLLTELE